MLTTRPKTTLGDLIVRFTSRPSLSPKSREYYRNLLGNFEWYARTHGFPEPGVMSREHIRDFLDYLATESHRWPSGRRATYKKAAPATVHHYGKALKALFNWAEAEEYLDHNPILRMKLAPPHYQEVEPYSDEEVRAMLQVCQEDARFRYPYLGTRNQAIISLFIATGLRLEELSRIGLPDIDPRLQEVRILGKGSKFRVVPVNGEARKALKRYLQVRPEGGDELWKTDDGQPMSLYSIKTMIVRLKRRAGVTGSGGAHRFRHYFATRYLEVGGDLNSLRLLLGHATLDMVLKYSRYVDTRRALEHHYEFNPLDRLYRGQNHNRRGYDWGREQERPFR